MTKRPNWPIISSVMSKKKTKTRLEKEVTHHHLDHIAKNTIVIRSEQPATAKAKDIRNTNSQAVSPQDLYIKKDLKSTLIIIGSFITIVVLLGLLTYLTGALNPILSHWGIKY